MIWQLKCIIDESEVSDGDVFVMCNLSMIHDTMLFSGKKGLVFIDTPLRNCNIPEDSKVYNCDTSVCNNTVDEIGIITTSEKIGDRNYTKLTEEERNSIITSENITNVILKNLYGV